MPTLTTAPSNRSSSEHLFQPGTWPLVGVLLLFSALALASGAFSRMLSILPAVLAFLVLLLACAPTAVSGLVLGANLVLYVVLGTANVPPGPATQAVEAATVLTIVALIRARSSSTKVSVRWVAVLILGGLALMYFAVDVASYTGGISNRRLLRFTVPAILTVLLVRRFSPMDMRVFTRVVLLFATVQAFEGAAEFGGVRVAPWSTYAQTTLTSNNTIIGGTVRAEGLAGHPIPYSMLMVFALLLVFVHESGLRPRSRFLCVVVFVSALVLSGSRSSIVALVVSGALALLFSRLSFGRRLALLVLSVGSVMTVVLSPTGAQHLSKSLSTLQGSGSYTHRLGALESFGKVLGVRDGADYFIGTGYSSELGLFTRGLLQTDKFNIVDNQFLSTMIWGGVLALGGLIVAMAIAFLSGPTLVRAGVCFVGVFMNSFDIFKWQGPTAMLMFFLALACFPQWRAPEPPRREAEPSDRPQLITVSERRRKLL